MTGVTNAELASAIQQVISNVDAREDQLKAWQSGSSIGGPFGDGRYPISNLLGEINHFKSPARLEYEVGLLTTAGTGALASAEAARDAALAAQVAALAEADRSAAERAQSTLNASQAQTFRNEAANSEANALAHRNAAQAAATAVAAGAAQVADDVQTVGGYRDDAFDARADTLVYRNEAQVFRDQAEGYAASINPATLVTQTGLSAALNALVGAAPGTLDTLNELAAALGNDPHFATTVTTQLAGKAPLVHAHAISDVSGLQAALDGKAALSHTHTIGQVTGLQAALDGKQAAGAYAAAVHGHVIADVSGLQAALDGKQPVGSYLTGITSSMVTTALGYTPYNSSNPAGYISGINSGMVTGALGYTPANRAGDTFTGLVTVSGSGAVPAVRLVNSVGGRDYRVWQKDDGRLTFTDETAVAERLSISSAGVVTANVEFRTPIIYDLNNTGFYSDPASTSRLNVVNADALVSFGNITANNDLIVGNGRNDSYIYMADANEGQRVIHNNSNRIGFLTQAGAWGSFCNDDGSWQSDNAVLAPIFYDSNDTGFFIDPNGGSRFVVQGNVDGGPSRGIYMWNSGDTNWGIYMGQSGAGRSLGGGTASASLFGATAHQIRFRVVNWDGSGFGWENSAETPLMSLSGGTGDLFVRNSIRTPIFYDSNNTAFYLDPNSTSVVQRLGVRGQFEYPGSINSDWDSGYYHFQPSNNTPGGSWGHAHIIRLNADWNVQMFFPTSNTNEPMWIRRRQNGTYSAWRRMLQEDEWIGNKYLGSDGSIYGTIFADANDSNFYVDPNGSSRLRNLNLGGGSGFDATIHIVGIQGGNGRLTQMSPSGASQAALNIMASRNASNGDQWFTWGVNTDNTWYINPGVGFNASTGIRIDGGGLLIGRNSSGTNVNSMNDGGSFSVRGDVNNAAAVSFHRTGAFAINMGLGTDNVFRIGGWSAAANCLQVYNQGSVQALNDFRAPNFYNSNDTSVRWSSNDFVLRGPSPTIFFRDTDSNSAMIHCNSNLLYVLRGGNDTEGWSTVNGHWPLVINLTNNDASFGGNISAVGNVTAYSDIRVKDNVEQIGGALDRLQAIRGVTYTRNDLEDKERRYAGVIAQEIEAVLPEAVFDSGDKKAVDYNATIGLLIEAIKELQLQVQTLQEEKTQ